MARPRGSGMHLAECPTQMDLGGVMCPEGPGPFSGTSASALAGSECCIMGLEEHCVGSILEK